MTLIEAIHGAACFLLDGAMGTELDKVGLMGRGEANLTAPEAVLEVHRRYAECGCNALTTNTLTMNRIFIESHGVNVDLRDVNRAGVDLARSAAGTKRFILGDMSSTGQLLEPYGDYSETRFQDAFTEQAEILAEGGVDGFIIETICDLREALCAVRACREFDLPIMASLSFSTESDGGRTIMGNRAADCAKQLTDEGADVVGANCGELDPLQMARIVAEMHEATAIPILVQPNAGKPRLVGERTVFDMTPDDFAEGIAECVRAGARIVGGCCGTSPEHIRAVVKRLPGIQGERGSGSGS